MSRLIDADALLQEFETENVVHRTDLWHIDMIKRVIEKAPIAFDMEKVLAELKDNCDIYSVKYYQENIDVKAVQIDDAIDIVRKGGIE